MGMGQKRGAGMTYPVPVRQEFQKFPISCQNSSQSVVQSQNVQNPAIVKEKENQEQVVGRIACLETIKWQRG
jgi:hypothetical protein